MSYTNLKIALRNLLSNKFFSLLNIFGLAVGMSACLVVILIIRNQLSYDKFHPNPERVFRIICQQADRFKLATVPAPVEPALMHDYSVIESGLTLVRSIQNVDATTPENRTIPVSGFYTEPSFFDILGFRLEAGNAATALADPNTIVLSQKMATLLFGSNDPLEAVLELKGIGRCRVTGIVAPPPGKSHLNFDCLVSIGTLEGKEQQFPSEEAQEKTIGNWENRYSSYVYVRLEEGKTEDDLSRALASVAEDRLKAGKSDKDVRYLAQNIHDITPRRQQLANDIGGGVPMFFLWGMGIFVLILIAFPCLNYANLAIARAMERKREIGIRKAIGARAQDVRKLLLTESVITSLLALACACVLQLPIVQFVKTYFPAKDNFVDLGAKGSDWIVFIAFGLFVGLVAGWLPAWRMSKIHPTIAFRGNSGGLVRASRLSGQSLMLVGQFATSLIFMIVVATLWSQLHYMTISDYGFQKENLLTVHLQGNTPAVVAAEMAQDPHVAGVCMTSVQVAGSNLQGISLYQHRGGDDLGIHCAQVDEQYLTVMGLHLIAGENFTKRSSISKEELLIVNEKALERFQLGSPQEAIGKVLWMNDSTPATVHGVIKDFNYRILEHRIEPFALRYAPTEKGYLMHLRVNPGDPKVTMASLASIWKKLDAQHPFDAVFMEASIQEAYNNVTFIGGLVSFFAALTLLVACMGLLGSVTHSVSRRKKEIGIRKVVGSSVQQLTMLLSQRFLILLATSVVIALPTGYWLSNQFLNLFVNRINVSLPILGGSAAIMLLFGLLAVSLQTFSAALANPVDSLRSE